MTARSVVLVVEDEDGDFHLIARWLRDTPFTLDRVVRFADALRRIERHAYDLVLLDLHLPDTDGSLDPLRILARQIEPILVTSGYVVVNQVEAIMAGADDVCSKDGGAEAFQRAFHGAIARNRRLRDGPR